MELILFCVCIEPLMVMVLYYKTIPFQAHNVFYTNTNISIEPDLHVQIIRCVRKFKDRAGEIQMTRGPK